MAAVAATTPLPPACRFRVIPKEILRLIVAHLDPFSAAAVIAVLDPRRRGMWSENVAYRRARARGVKRPHRAWRTNYIGARVHHSVNRMCVGTRALPGCFTGGNAMPQLVVLSEFVSEGRRRVCLACFRRAYTPTSRLGDLVDAFRRAWRARAPRQYRGVKFVRARFERAIVAEVRGYAHCVGHRGIYYRTSAAFDAIAACAPRALNVQFSSARVLARRCRDDCLRDA